MPEVIDISENTMEVIKIFFRILKKNSSVNRFTNRLSLLSIHKSLLKNISWNFIKLELKSMKKRITNKNINKIQIIPPYISIFDNSL